MVLPPEAWSHVKEIFERARTLPEDERAKYVRSACGGDEALYREVTSLLASHEQASSFLETPVGAIDDHIATKGLAGAVLGAYEVGARIGVGGMGEVYRARDTRLGRYVAIKVLLPAIARDADRLARFSREARVLAALNHPHIAQIYGLETSGGLPALVMELVEGPTLAERIARGTIPIAEALAIAAQVAAAVAAAHEQSIIHRDLKPANIKVREDGTVKVLDFGLAKALAARPADADAIDSPTLTAPTDVGIVLGTAAYMSPEQSRGRTVDRRADLWAFGCVVYEMLTGGRAFNGGSVVDVMAAVVSREPDWTRLPADTPAPVRGLLRRCLEKELSQRLDSATAARLEIDEARTAVVAGTVAAGLPATVARRPAWRRIAIPSVTWLIGVVMAGGAVWLATSTAPPRVSRLTITPPTAAALRVGGGRIVAITPDATRVVYAGANNSALFVRALDQLDAVPLTNLGGPPSGPFISPDGEWVGFFDGVTAVKKVAINGGPAVTIGRPDGTAFGASWGTDGTIIFATNSPTTGLQRIAADGGEPTVLTRPDPANGEADHHWPEILPGGAAVLFTITATTGGLDHARVAVLNLKTGTHTVLIRGGSDARYVPSGHLVYATAGTVRAVAFDLARLAVVGAPVPILPELLITARGGADLAIAADGTLVYVTGGEPTAPARSLVWVDRRGQETRIPAPPRSYTFPRLSPDGTRVALFIQDQELDIWTWELAGGTLTRATFDKAVDIYPVWLPNGRQLLFSSVRAGTVNLYAQAAERPGRITRLTDSPNVQHATSASPDSTRLVFTEVNAKTGPDIMQLELDGTHAVTALVQTPSSERNGDISPDGRWLAYEADDSGRFNIYVRPFPDVAHGHWQVTTDGGTRPLWSPDSHELFYLSATGAVMRVGVAAGPTWTSTAATKLFEGPYGAAANQSGRTYEVSRDGRRFLMIKTDRPDKPASLVVVQNWLAELARMVPTN